VAPDNALQFSDDGILYYQRWEMENLAVTDTHTVARYPLHQADPEGEAVTTVLLHGGVLVLVHHLAPTKPLWFREGGFPLAYDSGEPEFGSGNDWVAASIDRRVSFMAALHGYDEIRKPVPYGLETQGTNVVYPFSVIPTAVTRRRAPRPFLLISMVAGRGNGVQPEQLRSVVSDVSVEENSVTLRYADGVSATVNAAIGEVIWSSAAATPQPQR
jgi:hypothetical protein